MAPLGMRRLLLLAALAPLQRLAAAADDAGSSWGSAAAAFSAMGSVLQLCDGHGQCELLHMGEEFPARLCVAASDRPSMWLWPFTQMRLRLELDMSSKRVSRGSWTGFEKSAPPPVVRATVPSRGLCRWFGPVTESFCQDCESQPCHAAVKTIWGTRDHALYLPPYGGCLHIHKLPEGTTRAKATWERHFDPLVLVKVAVGLFLAWAWLPLRESVAVHASIGGVGSLLFVSSVVVIWLVRELKGSLQGAVPFGRSLSALSTLLLAFVPAARQTLVGLIMPSSSWDWRTWLSLRDPVLNLPVGAIATAASIILAVTTVMFGANIGMKHFATPPDPDGDVPFLIGPDGRRIDILPPPPLTQRALGWLFWLLGLAALLFSTHSDLASLLLLVLALIQEHIVHFVRVRLMMQEAMRCEPAALRPLMSPGDFVDQGRNATLVALARLQSTLRADPSLVRGVREDSELRLRRFSDGGAHFQVPPPLKPEESSRCWLL